MSYASAAALQMAIFARLNADTELSTLLGGAIHDAPPPGSPAGTYVVLGPEEVRDRSDSSGPGAEHGVVISVLSDATGFLTAKTAAARVSEVIVGAELTLGHGRLVGLWFDRATARRLDGGRIQRIDLRFRARVEG